MSKKINKILFYLIIYSFLGFCLETIVGIFTKGVLESRQSFVYGPFCVIYGIGAIILIPILTKFKGKNFKIFFLGMFLGSLVEYFGSLIGEKLLGFIWWDYSNMFLNINGRTSLFYAICWGIISIILINYLNPKVDSFYNYLINKLSFSKFQAITNTLAVLFALDAFISGIALNNFYNNTINNYNIGSPFELSYLENFSKIYENSKLEEFINTSFSKEQMIKIYPNILIPTVSGKYINVDTLVSTVQPYYFKVFEPVKLSLNYK